MAVSCAQTEGKTTRSEGKRIEENLLHRFEASQPKYDRARGTVAPAEAASGLSNRSAARRRLWRAAPRRIIRESPPPKSKARHPHGELRLREAPGLPLSTHVVCRYWQVRILCHQRAGSILRSRLDHPVSCIQNPISVFTMKLLLIDGHYYVYRSFFAIPNLLEF